MCNYMNLLLCTKMCFMQARIVVASLILVCHISKTQLSFIENVPFNSPEDEELFKQAILYPTEFIKLYGYLSENHTVYTTDGYILTMHRIPHGRSNFNVTAERKPVLLIHGIFATSSIFVDSGESSLGFYLADNGYDVWLGNMRGNFYSHHKKYSREDKKFWDFSWDEMAQYDATAMIDYVLKVTGFTKLPYIAHSMGSTVGLALFSSRPDYQNKVSGFIALSPIGDLVYSPTPARLAGYFEHILTIIINLLRKYNTVGLEPNYFRLEAKLCPYPNPTLCSLITTLNAGYSKDIRNESRDFILVNHLASGASIKTLKHYSQMMRRKGMYTYDYGRFVNLFKKNKTALPSRYLLDKIAIPVVLFHSANDILSDPLDACLLARSLTNLIGIELVGPPMMNHIDIMYALDAKNIYQDKLLAYLEKL